MAIRNLSLLSVAVTAVSLTGCFSSGSSSSSDPATFTADTAVVATNSSDFESGEVELIDLTQDELSASGGQNSTISNISIVTNGASYYLTEQFQADKVSRVDLENPGLFVWEYQTVDEEDEGSANPRSLVFAEGSKAYLPRYGSNRAWVVNVDAQREGDFKTGELDLSHYTPEDAEVPRPESGVVVNEQLFLAKQRLASDFSVTNDAYVSVWNTTTDQEVDTDTNSNELKGIRLNARNSSGVNYHPQAGIVVHGVGARDDENLGGIDQIDPDTFELTSWVTDQDVDSLALIDGETLYFTEYNAFMDVSLFRLNPSEPTEDPVLIESFDGADIRALAAGPSGNLWIADGAADNPGVRILDAETNEEVDFIPTELLPIQIDFADASE